jgi:hypothetical protein
MFMEWKTIMMWACLMAAIMVFAASCIGLGYIAGSRACKHKWAAWVGRLMHFAVACFWPVAVVGYTIYDARRYLAQHPRDDAPGMVVLSMISVGAPLLFILSLPLAHSGMSLAGRRFSNDRRLP